MEHNYLTVAMTIAAIFYHMARWLNMSGIKQNTAYLITMNSDSYPMGCGYTEGA